MDGVRSEACPLEEIVHFARVHGRMVEQMRAAGARRKFKYRVVLLGNQVKDQEGHSRFGGRRMANPFMSTGP